MLQDRATFAGYGLPSLNRLIYNVALCSFITIRNVLQMFLFFRGKHENLEVTQTYGTEMYGNG